MELLYQEQPKIKSTYTQYKNRSFTDSLESYQYGASKKKQLLCWNNRVPTKECVLHFLQVLSAKDIATLRTKIFRYTNKVILFQKGTGLHKFYQIGNWYTKSKKLIWEDIKEDIRKKYGTSAKFTREKKWGKRIIIKSIPSP